MRTIKPSYSILAATIQLQSLIERAGRTAWKSGADKGATGRPVPLLTHYLLHRAGKLN